MKEYRSNHIVRAMQWFKHGDHKLVTEIPNTAVFYNIEGYENYGWLKCFGSEYVVHPGDYIVENGGDYSAVNPREFEQNYEEVR